MVLRISQTASVWNAIVVLMVVLLSVRYDSFVRGDTRLHRRDGVTGHIPSTHEEVVSRREEHHNLFSARLEEVVAKLNHHERGGAGLLTEAEWNRLNRKKNAYENKLEELGREFDERHSRRILDREELLNDMVKDRIVRSRSEL